MAFIMIIISAISLILRIIDLLRKNGMAITETQKKRIEQLLYVCSQFRTEAAKRGISAKNHELLITPPAEDVLHAELANRIMVEE